MDDLLLNTLLNKTGKARFVDFLPFCQSLDKTNDIIEKIRNAHEYGYTNKSYETRVHNIKTIIKADRAADALFLIAERDKVPEYIKKQAISLLAGYEKPSNKPQKTTEAYVGETKWAEVKIRFGQNRFRANVIQKWGKCVISGYADERLLIASHIKPWTKSNGEEKINAHNGLLLLPTFDKLFDKGFITFDKGGHIMFSSQLQSFDSLGISPQVRIPLCSEAEVFMSYHRKHCFLRS